MSKKVDLLRGTLEVLTAAGRKQLSSETQKWTEMASVIGSILDVTPESL